jgi:hypothetical protein
MCGEDDVGIFVLRSIACEVLDHSDVCNLFKEKYSSSCSIKSTKWEILFAKLVVTYGG